MSAERIWFFTQNLGEDESRGEERGEISIKGYYPDEIEEAYGVREIAVGMILRPVHSSIKSGEKVIEILDPADPLRNQIEALKEYDEAFHPEGCGPHLYFIRTLLARIHELYVKEGVR